jgi:TonB-linked SusC/RagA family outer membrane protein
MEKARKFLPPLGVIMKISIVQLSIVLLTALYAYSSPYAEAQELLMKQVSIHVVDTEIKKVLAELESKADVKFVYTTELVPLRRKISLKVTNKSVAEVLHEMFNPDKVTYKVVRNRILLMVDDQRSSVLEKPSAGIALVADRRTIQGRVTDEKGDDLPGVNILIKGTQVGTTTNVDGTFKLDVENELSVLVFSFVGYLSKEVPVGVSSKVDVTLAVDNKTLDELVVVGYGTTKKVNLTGAVSQIDSKVLEDRPSPNLARMLQGTLPNLNISMRDGSPTRGATFNIRGTTSIGSGGSALVLIDGVEGDPNMLNPNDVESISILKDASSAAVYGSRAAFGVVLITTKKPVKGKTKIDFSSNFSLNQKTVKHNFITDGYPWLLNFKESFNAWYDYKTLPTVVNNSFPFDLDYLEAFRKHSESGSKQDVVYNEAKRKYEYFGSNNWLDEIYRETMPATEQALSISGGGDKASYLVSGRYYHQDGIFKHNPDKFNRYNLRAKGDVKINNWLTVQNNTELGTQDYYVPIFSGETENFWRNIEIQAFPMAVLRNPDETYTLSAARSGLASYMEGNNYGNETVTTLRNTAGIVATPFKDLTFKADLTFSKRWETDQKVNNYVNYSDAPGVSSRLGNSQLRQSDARSNYLGSNITATYTKVFDQKHNFSALVGYNVESYQLKSQSIQRDGLLVPGKPDFNLMDGINYNVSGGGNEWAYLGLFYRLNYNYADKYLLELNGRYDGSSKFPSNQRFGFFPSISGGWVISNERFFESLRPVLDNLKLRASYGTLGNGNVAPYRFLEQMSVVKSTVIAKGVQPNYTRAPGVIPDGLTWEKSTTMNFGVDLGLWSNAFNVTFDWYRRATNDMFTTGQPLPNVFGAAVPLGNYADLLTKGWELTVNYKNQFLLAGKPFNWGITGSVWDSKSVIQKYNNPNKLITTYYEGQEVGDIWGYSTLGLFKTDEEVLNSPKQSFLGNSNANVWLAGDLKFADLNNDGVINQGKNTLDDPGDRKVIGNNAARYNFGFTLSARWGGFGVSSFFQGIGKRDWYFSPEAGMFWGPYNRPYGYQPTMMMNDIWSEQNPDAYYPRMRGYSALQTTRSVGAPQTRYLQDISYLRLKTLTIDYSLPKSWTSKAKLSGVKIFLTAQNLFTFSGLFKHTDNFDPEVVETPVNDYVNGQGQGYAYPMLKTTTIGLNISL